MGVLWLNLGWKPEDSAGTGKTETCERTHEACPKQVVLGLENGEKSSLYDLNTTGGEKTNSDGEPLCAHNYECVSHWSSHSCSQPKGPPGESAVR